jgi:hypothetical protein
MLRLGVLGEEIDGMNISTSPTSNIAAAGVFITNKSYN